MRKIAKHLIPNTGVLIFTGLLLVVQVASARQEPVPVQPKVVAAPLISYQGTLTDESGNPLTQTVTMEFAMYGASSEGDLKWGPETQTVEVSNGLFHVLLGSATAINPADLTGDLWLDIKIDGEQMSPRERVAGVTYALAGMANPFTIPGQLVITTEAGTYNASLLALKNTTSGNFWQMTMRSSDNDNLHYYFWDAATFLWTQAMTLARDGTLSVPRLQTSHGAVIGLQGTGGGQLVVANNPSDNRIYLEAFSSDLSSSATELLLTGKNAENVPLLSLFATETRTTGILNMNGNSIVNCGALTEANLQTPEELEAGHVNRFEEGDVLCWEPKAQRLEKCSTLDDPLVQAVADKSGRPIVIGAEAVKVIGAVRAGDYLVASSVPGYAMASAAPTFGIVIAQALEDFDGDRGVIKAMIRKM